MNDYMILQHQEDIKFQQPQASESQQNIEVQTIHESTHREEYSRIMSFKGLNISRQSLINKLRQHHIYEEGINNYCQLSFPSILHSKNCEIMQIEVHLGWLLFNIRIINVDVKENSPVHACTCIGGGSFGKIYRYAAGDTIKAIKCFTINSRNRIQDYLTLAIAQYCLLKVASISGSGPVIHNEGFDIFFYKSEVINKDDNSIQKRYCIEFQTQCCENSPNFSTQDRQALFKSLHVIHLLNLVHCDIKPDNIMYSTTLKRWVFIDFGISTVLKENYGYCSKTKYKGTLKYSCPEMKKLYENLYIYKQQSQDYIDLYWNDAHGLKLSCDDIQKREKMVIRNHHLVEKRDHSIIQQHFLIADFKYCLYFGNKHLEQHYLDTIKWDKTNRMNIIYFLFELKSISEKTRTLFANFLHNFSEAIELIVFQKLLSDVKSSLNYDQEEDFICQQHVRYKRLFFREIPQCLEMARLENYNNEQLVQIYQTKHIQSVVAYVKSYAEGGKQDEAYLSMIFTAVNFLKNKFRTKFTDKVEICKLFYQQKGNTDELPAGVQYIKYFMCQALKVCLQFKKGLLHTYFIQIFANVLMLGQGTLQTIKAVYSTVLTISSNPVKTCQYFLQLYYLNFWSEQIIFDSQQKDYQQIKRYIVSVMHALWSRLQDKEDQLHKHCRKPDGFCMEMEERMLKRIQSEAFPTKDNQQSSFQQIIRRCQQTLKLFRIKLKRQIDDQSYYSDIQEIPFNLMYFFIPQFYTLNTESYARISYFIEMFISCKQISDQWGFMLQMKAFYKVSNFSQFKNLQIFKLQANSKKNMQRIRTYYEIIIQERYSQETTLEGQHRSSESIVRDCERALLELGNAFLEKEIANVLMKLKEVEARGIWHYFTILLASNKEKKERVVNTLIILYEKIKMETCLVRKDHLLLKLSEFTLRNQLQLPQYKIDEQAILNSKQQGSLLDIKLKYLQQKILEPQSKTKSFHLFLFHQVIQRNNRYNDFLLKTINFKVYINLLELLITQLLFQQAIDLICKISQNLLYLLSKKTALLSKKINMLLHSLFITKRYDHFKHWQQFRTLWVEKTLKERDRIAGFYNLTIVFIDYNAYELANSVYNQQNVPQLVLPSGFQFLQGEVLKKLLYGYSKFLVTKIPIFQVYELQMHYKLVLHLYTLQQQRHQYLPALHKKHLFRLHMKSIIASCPIDYEYALLAEKTKPFKKQEYYYNIYMHRAYPNYRPSLQLIVKEKYREKVDRLIHPHEGIINRKVRICN